LRENSGFYVKFANLKRIIFCVLSSGRYTCITGGQIGSLRNFQHPIHATHAQTSTETLKAVYFSLKATPGSRDMSGSDLNAT
jgi:hypothetical protein